MTTHRRHEPWDAPTGADPGACVDVTVPSVARAYDHALGGKNNFEVDRRAVEQVLAQFPAALELASANRHFLRRGVEYLVGEAGIRQIVEVGCGLPTADNVHEIAHRIDPSVRVVYADVDPGVVAHVGALLADGVTTTAIVADLADPDSVIDHPGARRFLDPGEPYAVLLAGVLHHLSDEQDPVGVTARLRDRMPSGSHLLTCAFLDDDDPRAGALEQALTCRFGSCRFRTWETQRRFFDGLEPVEPGLVYAGDWRPDELTPTEGGWHTFLCGGVGRKP
jgi:hypothetical protein